jgi:hypothetical protein
MTRAKMLIALAFLALDALAMFAAVIWLGLSVQTAVVAQFGFALGAAFTVWVFYGMWVEVAQERDEVRAAVSAPAPQAWFQLEARQGSDEHGRNQHAHWAEIDVRNVGQSDAHSVVARIVDKMTDSEWDPGTGERRYTIDDFSPITLGWTSGRDREDIPAGDWRTVLVAYSDSPQIGMASLNSMPHPTGLHLHFKYRVRICISAPDTDAVEDSYYIEPHIQGATLDGKGRVILGRLPAIEFERWSDWFTPQRSDPETSEDQPTPAPKASR